MPCIFCQIAAGERPATFVYQDDQVVAFRDVNPAAPVHILIIPREHISGPLDFESSKASLAGHLIAVAAQIARQEGVSEEGYRLVINREKTAANPCFMSTFTSSPDAT
jgi:histidine triad (HIT) family protein